MLNLIENDGPLTITDHNNMLLTKDTANNIFKLYRIDSLYWLSN